MSRLSDSRAILAELAGDTSEVIVWLSGGKDSVVVLDLAVEQFGGDNIVAVQFYQGWNLAFERVATAALVARYGLREHVLWPHPALIRELQASYFAIPRLDSMLDLPKLGHTEYEWLAREYTGMEWSISGQRKMDSLQRRGMLTRWGALDREHKRCHPIAEWNDSEVYAYCMAKRLPTIPRFGDRVRVSGLSLTPDVLRDIKAKHPADYERLLMVYPMLPALEMYATMQP